MSLSGTTQTYLPPTLDGLTIIDADQIYINGNEVDLNNLVPYTGATKTVNLGSQNIQTTHSAIAGPDLVNLTTLQNSIAYTEGIISTNFLNKLTTTAQTVAGAVTFNNPIISGSATASKCAIFNASKQLVSNGVDAVKLDYLDNVSSDIQTQLNGKLNLSGGTMTGTLNMGANAVTSSYVPSSGNDLCNKTYVDSVGGGSALLASNNTWTGTNNFLNTLNISRLSLSQNFAGSWTLIQGSSFIVGGGNTSVTVYNDTAQSTNILQSPVNFVITEQTQNFSITCTTSFAPFTFSIRDSTGAVLFTQAGVNSPATLTGTITVNSGTQLQLKADLNGAGTGVGITYSAFSLSPLNVAVNSGADLTMSTYGAIQTKNIQGDVSFSISPDRVRPSCVSFYGGSFDNTVSLTGGYTDCILFNTFNSSTYGDANLLALGKSSIKARIYQGTYGSSSAMTSYRDFVMTDTNASTVTLNSKLTVNDYIITTGNVGIGTTDAVYALTVKSVGYGITHTDGTIKLGTYLGGSAGGGWLGTITNHNLNFYTNDSGALMTIKVGGNVGIGTTDSETKLEVNGTANIIKSTNSGTSTNFMQFATNGTAGRLFIGMDDSNGLNFIGTGVAYGGGLGTVGSAPLAFITNNTIRMTLTAGGNVGIGTTTGGSKVNIFSSSTTDTTVCIDGDIAIQGTPRPLLKLGKDKYAGPGDFYGIGFGWSPQANDYSPAEIGLVSQNVAGYTYGDLVFRVRTSTTNTQAPERMRIMNNGNVGIGTLSATTVLQLAKSVSVNNDYSLMLSYQNTNSGYYDWQIGPYIQNGSAMFGIRGDADGFSSLRNIYQFTADSNLQLYGQASTGGGKVEFYQPDGTRLMYVGCPNSVSSTAYLQVVATRHLSIGTNDVERIWVKSNGKVALGMDGQSIGLGSGHINLVVSPGIWNPSAYNDGASVNITGDPNNGANCNALSLGQNFSSDYAYITSLQPGVVWRQLVIASSYTGFCSYGVQTAYNGPGGIVSTSDERCKEDIQPLNTSKSLQKILSSKPVHYRIKFNESAESIPEEVKSKRCIGLVAQDQLEVNPHCVSTWKMKDAMETEEDNGERLGICYNDINIHTVGAIQELHKKIESLQSTVDSLVERDKLIVEHAKQVENQLNTLRHSTFQEMQESLLALRQEYEEYKLKTEERMNKLVALFLSSKENNV